MKSKFFVLLIGLMLLSSMLIGCGGSSKSAFPTGKFVDATNENGGLIFNKDGTWSAYNGIYTVAKGTYSADNQYYTEESSNSGCPEPINFKYIFDGTNLNFNYVGNPADDPCDGRRSGFDNKTYILSK